MKNKIIFAIIAMFVLAALLYFYRVSMINELQQKQNTQEPLQETQMPEENITPVAEGNIGDFVAYTGNVELGSNVDKEYCANGVYFVSGMASFPLLMRPSESYTGPEFSSFVGKEVEASIFYTEDKIMCKALMCGCEDYVIVDQINYPIPQD